MDPLSALSLAGSIIQFVDFGTKLLSGAGELYKSPTGTLKINHQIELTTNDLKALITKLRSSFYLETQPDPVNEDDEVQRESFRNICDEAADVAQGLLERLSKLKVEDENHRRIRSIQQVIRAAWKEKEILALQERLQGFRRLLETKVIFSVR
jgi:hypothetical protein